MAINGFIPISAWIGVKPRPSINGRAAFTQTVYVASRHWNTFGRTRRSSARRPVIAKFAFPTGINAS
jgi:hypothetical protein